MGGSADPGEDAMNETLILRLDAPLMAFGGPRIDQIGKTRRFPLLSQITGLLGNALGYDHADGDRLNRLQDRLQLASLLLCPGEDLLDYQTVDLGQTHLVQTGWTTRGRREDRGKGEATSGTHIRYRYYRAGSIVLSALRLAPAEEDPNLTKLADALQKPARPLFIGRKHCLPASPLLAGLVMTESLADALWAGLGLPKAWGLADQCNVSAWPFDAELPSDAYHGRGYSERVVDRRDWHNQFHGGERLIWHGKLLRPAGAVA
jgi:CRISPR system Cascade subunit CasD